MTVRMRSKLFVPGTRPELFAKALAGDADAVSLDLEDAVPADRKHEARDAVASFLQSQPALATAKLLIVRVNAFDSSQFADDLAAVTRPGVGLINVPKVQSPEDVVAIAAAVERAEASNGVDRPIGLLLNIETPKALRHAVLLAGAHPRVAGLQLGLGDLFESLGIDRQDRASVHAAMYAVRLAAGEAGAFACDGAFAGLRDAEAFREEAGMARRLGYIGKSCIHPSQVALANDVFTPTAAEVEAARRIVEGAALAAAQGRGACVVDGRMVDAPYLQRARAIVAAADAAPSVSALASGTP